MIRLLKRLLLLTFIVVSVTIAGGALWVRWRIHSSLPVLEGKVNAAGLSAPVQILRDAHGVPHIRAQSIADAVFAQAYVTAQDRLWQMDLSRRRGEGELSEIFGDRTLPMDVESRTLGLPALAQRMLATLTPEQQRYLAAYTAGVNTFLDSHRDRLPLEFCILHYQPRGWREIDSVVVALNLATALTRTWESDLMRERIAARLQGELASDLFPDHSALDVPVADVADSKPLKPQPANPLSSGLPLSSDFFRAGFATSGTDDGSFGLGSNNWVVNGSHSKSGMPILANDPHLPHAAPSVWYMNHLKAPGLDVTGVSLPGLPFVVIGHNEKIGWGMTNTGTDVQDLFSETIDPRHPGEYLHNGQWIRAQVHEETVKVRGRPDYQFQVTTTRHGPVVSHVHGRELALQWTLLESQTVRLPFLQLNQAGNWKEFTSALQGWGVPMVNCVYADVDGNIGFYAAGLVPIRNKGNGSVPVPGSTDDYDWTGFVPFEKLPHSFNPVSGLIATANGRIVPDNYPYFLTSKWEAPFRTARIYELLRSGGPFTTADMLRIQMDILSREDQWLAQRLLAASAESSPSNPDSQFGLSTVKAWDGEARADSTATLVLEVTRRALLLRLLRPKLGENVSGYRWPMSSVFLENVLDANLTRWLPPGDTDFNITLMKSLDSGVAQIPRLVHSHNHNAWKWGDVITLTFRHPLGGVPFLGRWLNVGPVPQSGAGTTVKQTTPTLGPSMRMVIDFSDIDRSVQNITLGESGQAASPYYRDQFPAWYAGQSFPMLFSDAAVEKGAVHKLVLEPQR